MKIELSHDILARKIYEKSSTEDKMLLKIENLVRNDYERYQERNLLMSSEDYEYISPFLESLTITPEEQAFVDKSGRNVRRKQRTLNITIMATIAILALFGGLASYQSYLASEKAELVQEKNNELRIQSNALTLKNEEILDQNEVIEAQQDNLRKTNETLVQKEYEAQQAVIRAEESREIAVKSAIEARKQKEVADSLRLQAVHQVKLIQKQKEEADSLSREAIRQAALALKESTRADSLLQIAIEEKAKGDTLRGLSEARVKANQAIRLMQEGKILDGANLSIKAHRLNVERGGPYQNADCYAALDKAYQTFEKQQRDQQNDKNIPQLYKAHNGAIRCIATNYSDKRKNIIAYATEDEKVYVIDEHGYQRINISDRPRSIALSHNGNLLVVGTYSGKLLAYEYMNKKYEKLRFVSKEYKSSIDYIQIVEPFKNVFYIAFSDGKNVNLGFINFKSTRNRFRKELNINIQSSFKINNLKTAAFSNDGQYFIAVNTQLAQVFEIEYNYPKTDFSTNLLRPLLLNREVITAVSIGFDKNKKRHLIAFGLKNGTIRIADVNEMKCLINSEGCEFEAETEHKSEITKLIFNRSGDQLISSSLDKTAKIWNIANMTEERIPLTDHRKWIWDIAYNHQEDQIYTVSEDRSINVWVSRAEILAKLVQDQVNSFQGDSKKLKPIPFRTDSPFKE